VARKLHRFSVGWQNLVSQAAFLSKMQLQILCRVDIERMCPPPPQPEGVPCFAQGMGGDMQVKYFPLRAKSNQMGVISFKKGSAGHRPAPSTKK